MVGQAVSKCATNQKRCTCNMRKVVLAVEYGWQGMRELSLLLSRRAYDVDVIIKGRVPKDVLMMITKHQGMQLIAVPRSLFRIQLLVHCVRMFCSFKSLWVITQRRETRKQERTLHWLAQLVKIVPFKLLIYEEATSGPRDMPRDIQSMSGTKSWTSNSDVTGHSISGTESRGNRLLQIDGSEIDLNRIDLTSNNR